MSNKRNRTVFISHSSENKEIAEHLYAFLGGLGIKKENMFCSSLIGQGVDNGEKLNSAIAKAINKSSLMIYIISRDFLDSSYCMEELGIGWFLDIRKKADCYYLILPDIELSELKGFVNSKIDKFSFIDENHKDDLGLLAENICERMCIKAIKHSQLLNAESTFFSATRASIDQLLEKAKKKKEENIRKQNEIALLNEKANALSMRIEQLEVALKTKDKEIEKEKNAIELSTIAHRFQYLGFGNGISKKQFDSFSKDFWFSMLRRYYELEELTNSPCYDYDMEMLAATIYSGNGNYEEAYKHLLNYARICETSFYGDFLENVTIEESNNMTELVNILREKIAKEPDGLCHDSYVNALDKVMSIIDKRSQSHA